MWFSIITAFKINPNQCILTSLKLLSTTFAPCVVFFIQFYSILYFSIVDMAAVNHMYQTSLIQFLSLFGKSMEQAEKATTAAARVNKIVDTLTYMAYRSTNRGMYGRDRMSFLLIVAFKTMTTASILTNGDVALFLKGGAGLDQATLRANPFTEWMKEDAFRNVVQLSMDSMFYSSILDDVGRSEVAWRKWYVQHPKVEM